MIRAKLMNGLGQIVRNDWSGRTITAEGLDNKLRMVADGDEADLRGVLWSIQQTADEQVSDLEFIEELAPGDVEGADHLGEQQRSDLHLVASTVRARGLECGQYDGRSLRDWLGEISGGALRDSSREILHEAHPKKERADVQEQTDS